MEAILKINNQEIPVELTLGQVAKINKATIHYTDITSFEAACEFNGVDPVEFKNKYGNLSKHAYAYLRLCEWNKAINGGEELDYKDANVWKYWILWNSVGSASGFSFFDVYFGLAHSAVGSRLLYKDEARAEHAAEVCFQDYNDYING